MNRIWVRFLLVFVAGVIVGGAIGRLGGRGHRFYGRSPEKRAEFLMKKLSRDLDLRDDQKPKIQAIVEAKGREMEKLREEWRPRMEAAWAHARTEMRSVLDDQQWAKFEALETRMKERHQHRRHRPGVF
jgi:hypothetical protein